jgi:hypothetical protein
VAFKHELAARALLAHLHYAQKMERHITKTALAKRMSKVSGRRFTTSQVSSYQSAEVTPPYEVIMVYARATLTDPGWLAFGSESNALKEAGPRPEVPAGSRIANHLTDAKSGHPRR